MPDAPAAPKSALITGVAGQDGTLLARHLKRLGYEVHGTVRHQVGDNLAYLPGVRLHQHDVRDRAAFARLLTAIRPTEIYNLAGFTSVAASWEHAQTVSEVNGLAVLCMLDEIVRFRTHEGWAPRFYQASSSEMFGLAQVQPQNEDTAHHPRSPYAAAKSFAHHITVNYRESYGLFATSGILYNHESPLRPVQFVTRKVTQAAARIALGLDDHMTIGNVDVRRDWGAAVDYVAAMHRALAADAPGDFVIATGTTHSVRDLIDVAFAAAGVADPGRYLRPDPSLMRPAEVVELRGDSSRARDALGWLPTEDFESTIKTMVRADLLRIAAGRAPSLEALLTGSPIAEVAAQ